MVDVEGFAVVAGQVFVRLELNGRAILQLVICGLDDLRIGHEGGLVPALAENEVQAVDFLLQSDEFEVLVDLLVLERDILLHQLLVLLLDQNIVLRNLLHLLFKELQLRLRFLQLLILFLGRGCLCDQFIHLLHFLKRRQVFLLILLVHLHLLLHGLRVLRVIEFFNQLVLALYAEVLLLDRDVLLVQLLEQVLDLLDEGAVLDLQGRHIRLAAGILELVLFVLRLEAAHNSLNLTDDLLLLLQLNQNLGIGAAAALRDSILHRVQQLVVHHSVAGLAIQSFAVLQHHNLVLVLLLLMVDDCSLLIDDFEVLLRGLVQALDLLV